MSFDLPDLPYAYDALTPYMSAETLEFHHDKHHKVYVDTGNKLLEGSGLEDLPLEDVVTRSFGKNVDLFNNAAQHYNHCHYWNAMRPGGGGDSVPEALDKAIAADIGSFDTFRAKFIEAGTGLFGAGWCWLALKNGKLEIMATPDAENPLVHGAAPVLGCDVWEHAYYIDHRNRRHDYLAAFVDHLINWEFAEEMFRAAAG